MTMAWIAVGTAALGAGASIYGAKKQAKGAERAGDISMDMFNVLNRQQQPYMQGGYGAMGRLNTLLGLNPRPMQIAPMGVPQDGGMDPRIQRVLQGNAGTPQTRLLQQAMGQAVGQGGQSNPAYMPTPGGGVQPIMQVGDRRMYPHRGGTTLNRLLALRASQGDQQAQYILGRQV